MGAIHFNTIGLYNNNKKKSRNIHQQKTLTLTLNPNPNARFYQVKLENYGASMEIHGRYWLQCTMREPMFIESGVWGPLPSILIINIKRITFI